jgi:hypothetical protein
VPGRRGADDPVPHARAVLEQEEQHEQRDEHPLPAKMSIRAAVTPLGIVDCTASTTWSRTWSICCSCSARGPLISQVPGSCG